MDEDERESILKEKKEKKERKRSKKDSKEIDDKTGKKRKHEHEKKEKEKSNKDKEAMDRMKLEMEEMKQKIADLTKNSELNDTKKTKIEERKFALGYDEKVYLSMGFINSAIWITNTIAQNMSERMKENKEKWDPFKRMSLSSMVGTPCATFNREEPCHLGKWHTAARKKNIKQRLDTFLHQRNSSLQSANEELRIHACTLCLKLLGVMSGHSVVECPWILEKNWTTS